MHTRHYTVICVKVEKKKKKKQKLTLPLMYFINLMTRFTFIIFKFTPLFIESHFHLVRGLNNINDKRTNI